jgi:WD40 repeat protein
MKRGPLLALATAAAALLAPAAAPADIFAAVEVAAPPPRVDSDVAVLNASTGLRVALPAGTNTTAFEMHPGISTDGKRLTFERVDSVAGTFRVVVVDLVTSQSADLFNGFEAAQLGPSDPAISSSGDTVFAGGLFDQPRSPGFNSPVISTSLSAFPAGPFTHTTLRPQYDFPANGSVQDVTAGGSLVAFQETRQGFNGELILLNVGGRSSLAQARGNETYANPALAATNPTIVVFDQRQLPSSGTVGEGDIVFRPATVSGFVGTPTVLPPIVNSEGDESQPALTADERYLGFVRHGSNGHDRLFLWDSQTQTLLNAQGVDLGAIDSHDTGSVSLYSKTLFLASQVTAQGLINIRLLDLSGIGIVVQRILGTGKVLGKQAFKLGPARRVPLGQFKKGRHAIHWNLEVNGRKLAPGRYLVTPRAVTPKVVVRELGRPRVIRVR